MGGMAIALYRNHNPEIEETQPLGPYPEVPRPFKEPRHCDQVAYRIGDEAFPKMMALLEKHPQRSREFTDGSHAIYEEAIKCHVAPNVDASFSFYASDYWATEHGGDTGRVYEWRGGKKEGSDPESIFYIGHMHLHGPDPFRHPEASTLQKRFMQNWYSTFLHETRHILQGYAEADKPLPQTPAEIARHDPLKKYDKDLCLPQTVAGDRLCAALRADRDKYPHSADISLRDLNHVSQEKLAGYWKDLQQLWLRKDFPLLDKKTRNRYKEIFTHPDAKRSKLLEFSIKTDVIYELESYLVARKRMPGSTKEDIAPSDIRALACALYLRDMLRLYYQLNHTPIEKQHPYAQITPLELIE